MRARLAASPSRAAVEPATKTASARVADADALGLRAATPPRLPRRHGQLMVAGHPSLFLPHPAGKIARREFLCQRKKHINSRSMSFRELLSGKPPNRRLASRHQIIIRNSSSPAAVLKCSVLHTGNEPAHRRQQRAMSRQDFISRMHLSTLHFRRSRLHKSPFHGMPPHEFLPFLMPRSKSSSSFNTLVFDKRHDTYAFISSPPIICLSRAIKCPRYFASLLSYFRYEFSGKAAILEKDADGQTMV